MVMKGRHCVMWKIRKPGAMTVVFTVFALVYSLYSLNSCRTCVFQPLNSTNVSALESFDLNKEDGGLAESRAISTTSAGFILPTTIHTVKVEDRDGDEKCRGACSLGLQHICSIGRRECPAVLRTPARSSVAFEDLKGGDYVLTVNCKDSEQACYADPQEYSFHVEGESTENGAELKHIPLVTIKLLRKLTGRCSREQVWRSQVTCLGILYTLMGVGFLIISHTERIDHDHIQPLNSDHLRWLLQSKSRS